MKTPFWIHEMPLKTIFEELKKEKPEATFWDIFSDYNSMPIEQGDNSKKWLAQQKELIEIILKTHFADKKINRDEIAGFTDILNEFCYPEEEHDFDGMDAKYLPLAKKIYETHLAPLRLTEATFQDFIYQFETALEEYNHSHLMASGKVEFIKGLASLPHYSEEKKQEIIKNYLKMTESFEEEPYQDEFDEDYIDKNYYETESQDVIYPQVPLASSNTFFGFDDAGNLPYDEQERIALEKFDSYQAQITELLQQSPNPDLQPKSTANFDDTMWDAYYALAEANLQVYKFYESFAVWNDTSRILYLSMSKEDKETPFEIKLGGMPLADYKALIKAYNALF
ncbi:hypothetical protein [Aquimarina sp. SS2-1]|uniref:hypothetical protein n=1 Tax=Aquimarina besae TaxID=3342247 RepID=UPI00366B2D49